MSMQLSPTASFVGKDGHRTRRTGTVIPPIRRWLLGAAIALGCGVVCAAPPGPNLATATAAPSVPQAEPPRGGNLRNWNLRQTPIVEVVKRVRDAVVNIHSERTVR